MRSSEAGIQKLNELNDRQKDFDIDGSDRETYAKAVLRAQMKGILFMMNDVRYDTFKIPSNDPLEQD
jgi:hypothetical protein